MWKGEDNSSPSEAIHARLSRWTPSAQYNEIAFQHVTKGSDTLITGALPPTLTDFRTEPPSLLDLPVKNEIPARVEMKWRRMQRKEGGVSAC